MKDDIQGIAMLVSVSAIIIIITLGFVAVAQYLSGVAWRLGLTSNAAQWTIYAMALLLCVGVTLSILGRIVEGKWWWK